MELEISLKHYFLPSSTIFTLGFLFIGKTIFLIQDYLFNLNNKKCL